MVSKNTVCLWYNGTALDAAKFYAETFPDIAVGADRQQNQPLRTCANLPD
jgi:predicted 3-demethylubiquinone-9 3-methyltransferase (glyoxalase superfamily)